MTKKGHFLTFYQVVYIGFEKNRFVFDSTGNFFALSALSAVKIVLKGLHHIFATLNSQAVSP
jgi:hypothetical protein